MRSSPRALDLLRDQGIAFIRLLPLRPPSTIYDLYLWPPFKSPFSQAPEEVWAHWQCLALGLPDILPSVDHIGYTVAKIPRPNNQIMDEISQNLEKAELDAGRSHHSVDQGSHAARTDSIASSGSVSSSSPSELEGGANIECIQTSYDLERNPTALSRIATQRSQHSGTVGAGLKPRVSKKALPPFGAGKPYPPPLPEKEAYVVEFDGPDDPLHPQNWTLKKKSVISCWCPSRVLALCEYMLTSVPGFSPASCSHTRPWCRPLPAVSSRQLLQMSQPSTMSLTRLPYSAFLSTSLALRQALSAGRPCLSCGVENYLSSSVCLASLSSSLP